MILSSPNTNTNTNTNHYLSVSLSQDQCCLRERDEDGRRSRAVVVASRGRGRGSGSGVVGGGGPRPFSKLRQGGAPGEQPGLGLQLLPDELPQRGLHRPERHLADGRRQPRPPRQAPPPPLPRLLRQGVRRVDPAGQRAEREDGGAEPLRGGIRGDRRHQGADGECVPGGRLLRRHRRARRARRRVLPVQGVALAGGDRPAGRHRVAGQQHRRAAVALRRLQRPAAELRRQGTQPHRPRRALRRAHHRQGQLLQRHAQAVPGQRHQRRPAAGLGLRQDAHVVLPEPVAVGGDRGPGRRHAAQVRRQLLHQPAEESDRARLRRRAHAERRGGPDGRRPRQPDQVLRRLLPVHEEDGPRRRAHRHQRADQEAVPRRQHLLIDRPSSPTDFSWIFCTCFSLLISSARIKYTVRRN